MLSAGCAHVGPSRAHVEPSWARLGLMLGQVGPMLSRRAHLGPILAQVGPMLGSSWAHVGPMPCWHTLALCDTGWVGSRGHSAFNLRLPSKASGKDTAGHAPD